MTLSLPNQMTLSLLSCTPAPDLDGVGFWGPDVVGGPMCGYKMFRWGMIDEVTSISTYDQYL